MVRFDLMTSDPRDPLLIPADPSLGTRVARGIAIFFFQSVLVRVMGFAAQIVLAYLLLPDEFGLIALVYSITALPSIIGQPGVDDVLQQRARRIDEWTGSAAAVAIVSAGIGSVVMIALAMLVVNLAEQFGPAGYADPRIIDLSIGIALALPLNGLTNIALARLRAAMRFKTLAGCATIDVVLTHLLTIGLAFWGAGVWSFVLPNLLLSLIRPWVYGHLAGMIWREAWLVSRWRSLLGAVKWTLPGRLSIALMHNGDYAILGLLASRGEVGIYYFAFALANQFIRTVSTSLATTLMPAWVELNDDRSRRDAAAVRSISVAMTALSPLVIAQAAVAEPAIALVYRGRWESAVLTFAILSLSLMFEPLRAIAQSILSAAGRFRVIGIMQFVQAVVFLAWVAIGAAMGGHVGAAVAVATFGLLVLPLWAWIALGRAMSVVTVLRAPLVAGCAFVGPWLITQSMHAVSTIDLILEILIIVAGGVIYVVLARIFMPEDIRAIRSRIGFLRPRQPASAQG